MGTIGGYDMQFESLVNTEGFQTTYRNYPISGQFESLVNTEGFQTSVVCPYL